MRKWAYYNDIDPYVIEWCRNLARRGLITDGEFDTRSIADVQPEDVRGFSRVHFFCGLAGWEYALRLANWGDDPVWTGSCPCQPFSVAGKRRGTDDERHLWPEFHRLIGECRPPVVFGEQVASKAGRQWLAGVRADLEDVGYAVGAADLCAAGVGAPHIRQRLYWVAYADGGEQRNGDVQSGREYGLQSQGGSALREGREGPRLGSDQLDDAERAGLEGQPRHGDRRDQPGWDGAGAPRPTAAAGAVGGLADAAEFGRERGRSSGAGAEPGAVERSSRLCTASAGPSATGPTNGFWRDADWLCCRDGKWRPVEPGTFPLAHGIPARVAKLRAIGNAIVPEVAAEFISAAQEACALALTTLTNAVDNAGMCEP